MIYRAIGLMSGSSLDGLDIVYTEIHESRGNWTFDILATACIPYSNEWLQKLNAASTMNAYEFLVLHSEYGKYTADKVNEFIEANDLHHKVQLIASHGHTIFHAPAKNMTMQLGNGAAIAAGTGINTVSDLRNMDVALNGQGAPIVPVGEKLFWPGIPYFLNLGGIANISFHVGNSVFAFDVCAANRVLNMLAAKEGKLLDENGSMAESGNINNELLEQLNSLDYYRQPYPKSLANEFGIETVFPILSSFSLSTADALCTYTEHIAIQIADALLKSNKGTMTGEEKIMIAGGGAFNTFLIKRIEAMLGPTGIKIFLPDNKIIQYKEALIMALTGVLRWREENTVLHSVTGAIRSSIGGAVWIGQEA